jgi:hypothetical protein
VLQEFEVSDLVGITYCTRPPSLIGHGGRQCDSRHGISHDNCHTDSKLQDDISLDYDPLHNRDYWQRRPVAVVQRSIQIAGAFGAWFLRGKLQSQRQGVADSVARYQAEQLRHILTRLGPAFVKIGQVSCAT